MKNKKGFTLIELLAVIVILGVLLLVAVPMVSKIITGSQKVVAKRDGQTIVDAIENCGMSEANLTACEKVDDSDAVVDDYIDGGAKLNKVLLGGTYTDMKIYYLEYTSNGYTVKLGSEDYGTCSAPSYKTRKECEKQSETWTESPDAVSKTISETKSFIDSISLDDNVFDGSWSE